MVETLGDYCKWLEKNFSPEICIPKLPVIVRLDGCNFHKYTQNLNRPFDCGFIAAMQETTVALVEDTNALMGYCQSDEITLLLYSPDKDKAVYHAGKKQKIVSKLAVNCSQYFNTSMARYHPAHGKIASFDCRIYQTPTKADATNQFLWREHDAVRNSIQGLGRKYFSHKELDKLSSNQIQFKLFEEKGVNWDSLSSAEKRGSYFKRVIENRSFTTSELEKLPENHAAKKNPDLTFDRAVVKYIDVPPLSTVTDRVKLFFGDKYDS
jgi:tRNA(His) 5'-end guanylyltransferase